MLALIALGERGDPEATGAQIHGEGILPDQAEALAVVGEVLPETWIRTGQAPSHRVRFAICSSVTGNASSETHVDKRSR